MKKLYLFFVAAVLLSWTRVNAQAIVTTEPSPLQEDSEDVTIIYHADQGNMGLKGLTGATPVFAHIGVITNLSDGSWAYAPSKWGDNDPKYELEYIEANTWELYIGNIREYFGITNPKEVVEKIAMVFRTADCSREGKTATGGDIFVDVLASGFQMEFSCDAPLALNSSTANVTFKAGTTQPATIEFFLNSVDGTPFASAKNATSLTKTYKFSQGDSYKVIARATCNAGTVTDEINICYPSNSTAKAYPGGKPVQGAVKQSNGDVIFCLAAPGKSDVMIIPSWDNYEARSKNVMNYTDVDGIRYFWTTVSGLDNKTDYPYYYLVDESIAVGDPYARFILDPYSDKWLSDGTYPGLMPYPKDKVNNNVMLAVYNGSRDDYNWRVKNFKGPKKQDLIVYELLLRDFTGTEGKAYGDGTLKKAMGKLDYLQRLGVNAIELMPIQEFNGNNSWGYNTNFYFAPDKAYGSPEEYRAFIDECHARGMAVILDVVFNQSDGLHPWYQMYPIESNPFYNARAPHAYSVLNDWNQDNMLVRQQWKDMVTYWMQAYKVDGFRFDLVKGLGLNASYGGNANDYNTNKYNASRVQHMKEITDVMFAINPDSYSINENLAGTQEENEMAANGQLNWANINDAACQFAMGYDSDSDCNRFYAPKNDNRTWGSTVSYAESHDEQRVAYKQNMWGVSGVKGNVPVSMRRLGSLAAQMLLAPGAHMIWQFEELGNDTNTKNSDGGNNTDPKPVLWSYFDNADRKGLYENYADLINLRKYNPDLFAQGATFSMSCSSNNWKNGRFIYASTGNKELICVINPNTDKMTFNGVTFKSSSNADYVVGASSYGVSNSFSAKDGSVTLEGGAFVVLINKNVNGVETIIGDTTVAPMVYGGEGCVIVNGDYSTLSVYNLNGALMPANQLRPGVYVAVVDGVATKVLVR